MKNIVFVLLLSMYSFAQTNVDEKKVQTQDEFYEFNDEFDKEFIKQETKVIFDPLSGYNRVVTSFNDSFYVYVLNPVSTGYANVIPEKVRVSFSNFFGNLLFPVRFVNNLLQFKLENSAEELGRFVINTIWGLGGFLDPAKEELGLSEHNEDFGQTLGYWGIGDGFHVVLPFLGPSNIRDIVGIAADSYISPLTTVGASELKYKIPNHTYEQLAIMGFDTVNSTSLRLGQYEALKKDALDLYPFLRDVYTQKRNNDIEE